MPTACNSYGCKREVGKLKRSVRVVRGDSRVLPAFVYATLSLNRLAHRLVAISKKSSQRVSNSDARKRNNFKLRTKFHTEKNNFGELN